MGSAGVAIAKVLIGIGAGVLMAWQWTVSFMGGNPQSLEEWLTLLGVGFITLVMVYILLDKLGKS